MTPYHPCTSKGARTRKNKKPPWWDRDYRTPSRYAIELNTPVAVARVFRDWMDLYSEPAVEDFAPTMFPNALATKDTLDEPITSGHAGNKPVVCSAAFTASVEFGDMLITKSMQWISTEKRCPSTLDHFLDSLRCLDVTRKYSNASCRLQNTNGRCESTLTTLR